MNRRGRNGGITLWAWLFSIILHGLLLLAFALMQFAHRPEQGARGRPAAGRAQIKRIAESSPLTPKPKVMKLLASSEAATASKRPLDIPVRSRIGPADEPGAIDLIAGGQLLADADLWSKGVEFFGQFTDVRKICYVVDCSGSMHGRIGLVKNRLKTSIASLKPDQFFCVIFFLQGDTLLESSAALVRATPSAKAAAYDFVDEATPAGTTDPLYALERAMQLRDAGGAGPGLIYFLTDGFDFQSTPTGSFAEQVCSLRRRVAGSTVINTIGFWTQPADERILRDIAEQCGGEFASVEW